MPDLPALLSELTCGDDDRAETAAVSLAGHPAESFAPLRQLLLSPDVETRWWAVRALAGFPASQDVSAELIAALSDPSGEVRQCAALGLCHQPSPDAILPLIRALSDGDSMVSGLAANALAILGHEAVPGLLAAVENGSRPTQLGAVRALAQIKDYRAIPALMKILEKDSALMQYWAETGLDNLGLGMVYLEPK
jgi:HEAT repeat protein